MADKYISLSSTDIIVYADMLRSQISATQEYHPALGHFRYLSKSGEIHIHFHIHLQARNRFSPSNFKSCFLLFLPAIIPPLPKIHLPTMSSPVPLPARYTPTDIYIPIWVVVAVLLLLAGFAVLSVVLCLDNIQDSRRRANNQDVDVGKGGGRRWLRWHNQHNSSTNPTELHSVAQEFTSLREGAMSYP